MDWERECCFGVDWRIVPLVVCMSVVVLLVVRGNYSWPSECYMVCLQIHSVCSRFVGTVHIAHVLSKGTFEFVCTYLRESEGRQ
jgi:hypothetical protein